MAKRRTNVSRKRRKRKNPILFFLKFIVIIGVLYAIMFHTPALLVTEIFVTGNTNVETEMILQASELGVGNHLLKIKYDDTCRKIEKIPYVSVAEIKYKFPNKLNINITESEVLFTLDTQNGFVSIDKNMKILEINDNPKTFPVIFGLNSEKILLGEKLVLDESQKFDIILLYGEIFKQKNIMGDCEKITLENGEVTAEFAGGIKLMCGGRDNAEYKVAAFCAARESNPEVTIGTFDVRNPEKVIYRIE